MQLHAERQLSYSLGGCVAVGNHGTAGDGGGTVGWHDSHLDAASCLLHGLESGFRWRDPAFQ